MVSRIGVVYLKSPEPAAAVVLPTVAGNLSDMA